MLLFPDILPPIPLSHTEGSIAIPSLRIGNTKNLLQESKKSKKKISAKCKAYSKQISGMNQGDLVECHIEKKKNLVRVCSLHHS
jgi:hypothetical protein